MATLFIVSIATSTVCLPCDVTTFENTKALDCCVCTAMAVNDMCYMNLLI